MAQDPEYLLGVNTNELERLRLQHGIWKPVTDAFLDRIAVQRDWKCLDVGAGPGFVTLDLRERVGETGSVTALEPSSMFLDYLRHLIDDCGWKNIDIVHGSVEETDLPQGAFDLVFVRWVLNFVPDRNRFLSVLAKTVKPGGIIAVEDYWYEGLSVFPKGTPFDRIPDIARKYYASGGGDASGIGIMPSTLMAMGFDLIDLTPRQQAGGNTSPVFLWASRFFRMHLPMMADRSVISQQECDTQLNNLDALSKNPNMLFFSPIVLDCAMKKRG